MDGFTTDEPLSSAFSYYMVNMENDIVISSKPIFYQKFIDSIYSKYSIKQISSEH